MLCYRKFVVAEKFMEEKWGWGVSKFSVESFLSQCAQLFRGGTLLSCVSEIFW